MQRPSKRRTQQTGTYAGSTKKSIKAEWDKELLIPKLTFWEAASVITGLAIICFANSYDGEFVFDDSEAIINNKDVDPSTPIVNILHHDFWGSKLASNTSHKSYRPLTVLTFRISYYLAGGLEPFWFHIPNIALHAIVCVLFLQVFSVLLGGCKGKTLGFEAPRASFSAALLFAAHPIHTECVSAIVGRADLLCAFFVLLAFLAYVKSTLTDLEEESTSRGHRWMAVAMLCTTLAVCCKEVGITVLGLCSAYDILGHHKADLIALIGLRPRNRQGPSVCIKASMGRQLILFCSGVVILTLRMHLQGGSPPTFQVVDNPQSFVESLMMRTLNYNYIYALNLWLLLTPHWLCFDWSMGCVPVIEDLSDPRLLGVLALWVGIVCVGLWCFSRPLDTERRLTLLGLAILIIPFSPASNLLFRVGFVIAERILYLPCAGFIILLVLGAAKLSTRGEVAKHIVCGLFCVLLLMYSFRSYQRSNEWRAEKTLFESGAQVCPLNAKVHYNLGKTYADAGDVEKGISEYRLAIKLHPRYDQAMNNLANILKDRGEVTEAEQLLELAVSIRPEFAAAWMNLGIAQASLQKNDASERSYHMALTHRRHYPDCYYNLGNLYLDLKRHNEALAAWRNATLQKPGHVSAWGNMLLLLDNLERLEDLETVATEALQHNPDDASLHFNYASALGRASQFEKSEKHFLAAIQLQPNMPSYHSNLGVLYHRWGRFDSAEDSYKTALELDPTSKQTQENLSMLIKKMRG